MSKKVWLITGAGRGMGVEFARAALASGHSVVASGRDRERQNDRGKRAGAKASSRQERHDVEEKVNENHTVKREANKRMAAAQQCGYRRGNPDRRNVDGQKIRCRNWTVWRRGQFQD